MLEMKEKEEVLENDTLWLMTQHENIKDFWFIFLPRVQKKATTKNYRNETVETELIGLLSSLAFNSSLIPWTRTGIVYKYSIIS